MPEILIIEDERPIAELLKYSLDREGYAVRMAHTGADGLAAIESALPDLILLDLMLPDMDGLDICRQVTQQRKVPIIIVSAKNDQVDKIIGLEYGADDYITKPFDIREVLLRMQSVLRRGGAASPEPGSEDMLRQGDLCLIRSKHEVKKGGMRIELTPKEFDLLAILLENKGKVLSRAELLEKVWEFAYIGDTRTVDIHIQRLRRKLGADKLIETVFGVGYKIRED